MPRAIVLVVLVALLPAKTEAQQPAEWTARASLNHPRYNFGATTYDGRIYVFGGTVDAGSGAPATASIEAYDAASDRWVEAGEMTSPRTHAAACTLGDLIYVIGGAPEERVAPLPIVEAWDPRTGQWTRKADLPTARMNVACVVMGDRILAIGGQVSDGVGTVEEYDPAMDTWRSRAELPTPRAHLVAAEVGGKIYAIGGATRAGTGGTVEEYDPSRNVWTARAPIPTPRTSLAGAVTEGRIYVLGGSLRPGGEGLLAVEAYDPATDSWSPAPDLGVPRVALAAATLEGRVFAIGGSEGPWPFQPLGTVQAMNPSGPGFAEKAAPPDTATIRLPGREMHSRSAGSGEVLLLLHGFMESGS